MNSELIGDGSAWRDFKPRRRGSAPTQLKARINEAERAGKLDEAMRINTGAWPAGADKFRAAPWCTMIWIP